MPKLVPPTFTVGAGPAHPVLGRGIGPHAHAVIGEAGGLTQFGVHPERLPPGSRSSFRRWHAGEDEMTYVLSDTLVPIEDGETALNAGEAACWPAGPGRAHRLENRSGADALYLVAGTRAAAARVTYPDHDLVYHRAGTTRWHTRADGTPITGANP